MDRQRLTFDQVRKIDRAGIEWKRWTEMIVACQGRELGCGWAGIAKEYEDHAVNCQLGKMSRMLSLANRTNRAYDSYIELAKTYIDKIESIREDYDAILQVIARFRQVCETEGEHEKQIAADEAHGHLEDLLDTAEEQSREVIQSVSECCVRYQSNPEMILRAMDEMVDVVQDGETRYSFILKSSLESTDATLETHAAVKKILARIKVIIENKSTGLHELDELLKEVERLRCTAIGVRYDGIKYYERMLETKRA